MMPLLVSIQNQWKMKIKERVRLGRGCDFTLAIREAFDAAAKPLGLTLGSRHLMRIQNMLILYVSVYIQTQNESYRL